MATLYELKEEIIQRTDIVELISEYVRLKRMGSTYAGKCPFHNDKSPSFYVWSKTETYYCFGCKKGGDAISFIMEMEKISFKETLELLAKRQNIIFDEFEDKNISRRKKLADDFYELNKQAALYFFNLLKSHHGAEAQKYIVNRKLKPETVVKFGLGYCDSGNNLYKYLISKGFRDDFILKSGLISSRDRSNIFRRRLMFPIFNENNKIVGFGGRTLGDDKPKYLNTPENDVFNKKRNLYGLNYAKKTHLNGIILVEGYMDVISLHQSGVDNACASLGTSLTVPQIGLLKKYSKDITICYDSDEAGKNAANRAANLITDEDINLKIFLVPDGKDPDEFIKAHGPQAFLDELTSAEEAIDFKINFIKKKYLVGDKFKGEVEKLQFLDEVLKETINNINDEIKKQVFIKRLAEEFSVSTESIYHKLELINSKQKNSIASVDLRQNYSDSSLNSEKYLIRVLMQNPDIYNYIKDSFDVEFLSNDNYKDICNIIIDILKQGKNPSLDLIKARIPEGKYGIISNEIASIFNNDSVNYNINITHDDKVLQEILYKIKKAYYEKQLKSASQNSDWEAMKEYGNKLSKILISHERNDTLEEWRG